MIPASAVQRFALAQVRERGHRLLLCTGRSVPEVYPFLTWVLRARVGLAGMRRRVATVLLDEAAPAEHVRSSDCSVAGFDAFYVAGLTRWASRGYLSFSAPGGS